LVATRDPKLKIYDPSHPVVGHHPHSPGEMVLLMKSETTLLSKARVRSGRQPVAMATGYLLPASVKRRHKVIVVLTHDWTVMCFDHHLKLLWESNPMKVKLAHAYHREASISITPTKIKPFDTGLVVVGASMVYEDHKRLHRRKPKSKKKGNDADSDEEASRKRNVRDRIKEMLGLPAHRSSEDDWQVSLRAHILTHCNPWTMRHCCDGAGGYGHGGGGTGTFQLFRLRWCARRSALAQQGWRLHAARPRP
jgi:hypothetical protein